MLDKKKIEVNTFAKAITQRPIVLEMEESYLDYAMSVIVSRALPDVRDGLKPVHRRILYAMWNIGLRNSAKFRKSATVVGEVLGKYHPHGDSSVYDALVRLAQDFSMRYPLVHGQGNFGSMDGDAAAAMRYTEAKLTRIAEEMLYDIEKDTVNFMPNYDGNQREPRILPSKLPNLLLSGTVGIAVGMATNVPPHNLSELIDGVIHIIDNPDASIEDLMQFVKGPDFPTGGIIFNIHDIRTAYATGKGSIVMRAKTDIQEMPNGFTIVVNEIPYQVNKADLLANIAELVKDKKIDGIKDLRDESDRDGVRVVIELKREAYPRKVLNRLFQLTNLQTSFHVNMLALVDGIQPRVLTLKMALEEHLKHRKEVIRRRTTYDLERAKERAHILEGLRIALVKIDAVIKTIKQSRDRDEAKTNLIKQFKLSERQAIAILEMKLQQLANLERLKVEQEYKEKQKLIQDLQAILKSDKRVLGLIKDELLQLKERFGDSRRTEVQANPVGEFSQEDLIPNEATVVVVTHDGYVKRLAPETFKRQGRGGKGVIGLTTKEHDAVEQLVATMTHADLLFFTSRGRVFQLKAYDVPVASRTAKGQALVNFLQLGPDERVTSVDSLKELKEYKHLAMVTLKGVIKRVHIEDFTNVRRSGLIAIRLRKDDTLQWVLPTTGNDDIAITSANGQAIRFRERQVRVMGRNASGVRGIRLRKGDMVAGLAIIEGGKVSQGEQLLVVMKNGFGKRTNLSSYKVQGRGGSGVKTAKTTPKTGAIIAAFTVNAKQEQEDIVIMSDKGQVIRLPLKSVSVLGRATQGVRLMRFSEPGDGVATVTFV
ncbi:MAG: gyrase subunit A protein [Parcubacteria group bacterium GW2011_GWC2_49_9]|nr:MAG: gyrase subunit A protein [Parcubacteria group bacterium GW2011_GWA2_48_9]KKW16481.1 MAG: gyrase subunit A protein [Parcubacteria group bacterium GW2011_GWC2_49_9]